MKNIDNVEWGLEGQPLGGGFSAPSEQARFQTPVLFRAVLRTTLLDNRILVALFTALLNSIHSLCSVMKGVPL
jgi:hypothetical protein